MLADGKPLTGGWIYFVPKGDLPVTPSGVIGPDGTFSLVTGGSGEGAPPGDYKVRVESPQSSRPVAKSRKKPRHSRSSTTTRTARAWSSRCEPRAIGWSRSVLK